MRRLSGEVCSWIWGFWRVEDLHYEEIDEGGGSVACTTLDSITLTFAIRMQEGKRKKRLWPEAGGAVSSCLSRRVRDSIYDAGGPWIATVQIDRR